MNASKKGSGHGCFNVFFARLGAVGNIWLIEQIRAFVAKQNMSRIHAFFYSGLTQTNEI